MSKDRPKWIAPASCFSLALLVRALAAWRVEIPGRDGVTYLWMGEQVARGNFEASFGTVFPPVYPWCIAAVLSLVPGIDPMLAGQVASGLLASLAVFPLFWITQRLFDSSAAILACLLFALGTWFVRHPADCMSEGPFYLWVGCAVLLLLSGGRSCSAIGVGLCIALAYGTRPEGAGLACIAIPWTWMRDRRRAVTLAVATALFCSVFPVGYAVWGDGFTLTPKAGFMWPQGAGRDEGGGALFYLENLVRMPGYVFEALGYLATVFMILGIASRGDRSLRGERSLLLGLFALQLLVIPFARANIRFVSGYGMLMLAFAGQGFSMALRRQQRAKVLVAVALGLLAFGPDLVRLTRSQREEKAIERELGLHLRARMQPGEFVVSAERRGRSGSDQPFAMCRLEWYAGMEPSPPRPMALSELRAMAMDPRCRFGLIAFGPSGFGPEDLMELGYFPYALPPDLAERAAARSIVVLERR